MEVTRSIGVLLGLDLLSAHITCSYQKGHHINWNLFAGYPRATLVLLTPSIFVWKSSFPATLTYIFSPLKSPSVPGKDLGWKVLGWKVLGWPAGKRYVQGKDIFHVFLVTLEVTRDDLGHQQAQHDTTLLRGCALYTQLHRELNLKILGCLFVFIDAPNNVVTS